jgi:agmatinase
VDNGYCCGCVSDGLNMSPSAPFNFGGLSPEFSTYGKSKIVILPIAFDKTSSWLRGSRRGPRAIIDASRFMELYDMETESQVYQNGIHTLKPIRSRNSKSLNKKVTKRVAGLLGDDKFVVVLGGEHSVSLGSIAAHLSLFPEMGVLHLDAHADLRESYEGNPHNHACVMARARDYVNSIVSVGIRSMDVSERENLKKVVMIPMAEIDQAGNWMETVLGELKDIVYVTIDLDVLDSGIMPATGTPEPGGLQWNQLMNFLSRVSETKNIVGFDVVELCPSKNRAPDYLAAKLVYKLLSMIFQNRN